jgi:hypothetical protein
MTRLDALLKALDRRLFPPEEEYGRYLRRWILADCRSVLDVGCGDEGGLIRFVPGVPYSVGIDKRIPEPASQTPLHTEYLELDIRLLAEHFEPRSFDCVVALDVVEHLSREDGFRLLDSMETIASKRVIVFTPNGFLPQPPAANNPYQQHLSGWTTNDLERLGYRVVGINGWKPLRGPYASIRWRPTGFWRRVSLMTQPLVASRPRSAFQLLCVKDVVVPSDSK